jgi:hypothetical protein
LCSWSCDRAKYLNGRNNCSWSIDVLIISDTLKQLWLLPWRRKTKIEKEPYSSSINQTSRSKLTKLTPASNTLKRAYFASSLNYGWLQNRHKVLQLCKQSANTPNTWHHREAMLWSHFKWPKEILVPVARYIKLKL